MSSVRGELIKFMEKVIESLDKMSERASMDIELFRSISNQIAISNKLTMEFIEDLKKYRGERERQEEKKQYSTTERVQIEVTKAKVSIWEFFRDRVIPALLIAVILKIWGLF